MYHFILSAVSGNQDTLEDTGILPIVEMVSKAFTRLPIPPLINFHCGYDQTMLHKNSWDYIAFQTPHGMHPPTRQE